MEIIMTMILLGLRLGLPAPAPKVISKQDQEVPLERVGPCIADRGGGNDPVDVVVLVQDIIHTSLPFQVFILQHFVRHIAIPDEALKTVIVWRYRRVVHVIGIGTYFNIFWQVNIE